MQKVVGQHVPWVNPAQYMWYKDGGRPETNTRVLIPLQKRLCTTTTPSPMAFFSLGGEEQGNYKGLGVRVQAVRYV